MQSIPESPQTSQSFSLDGRVMLNPFQPEIPYGETIHINRAAEKHLESRNAKRTQFFYEISQKMPG
ncbi:MAG: hypothetical protein E6I93_14700 [Chloroflexi bacterium]|nr:MAG: hypothetical protein E6I93_14700 [Chloroflexota bacterium]